MRQLIILFLAFSLILPSAWAQNNEADLFMVTDVDADVTANSAAQARDQAITEAQHTAFDQLLDRLGVDKSQVAKLSDDDLATLVQNFEVQNERTSSVRYIGIFTVQFRPNAVRTFLGNHLPSTIVARSKPLLLLPIVHSQGHSILWEESTKWRTTWEKSTHNSGLVPLTLPAGDLDDIALISTDEAMNGKSTALKALINKYQTNGAVVAILNLPDPKDTSAPASADGLRLDIQRYNAEGLSLAVTHFTLPATTDSTLESTLIQGIKQTRNELEKAWRQESKFPPKVATPAISPKQELPDAPQAALGPLITLPVTVPLVSLTEWAQIRGRLNNISAIQRTEVITLARGATSIEIVFSGTLGDLKTALENEGLSLTQNLTNGGWILRPDISGDTQ